MARVVCIVEGHGDRLALPILVRRIATSVDPSLSPEIPPPIRVGKRRLLKEGELERAVELAGRQSGPEDAIVILLDADDDCPAELGPKILARARTARSDRNVHVVLAKVEYETWLITASASIAGRRGLAGELPLVAAPETVHDPKGWLSRHMKARSYQETLDQPALTALFDLEAARAAPSFDKMWRTVREALRPDPRRTTP